MENHAGDANLVTLVRNIIFDLDGTLVDTADSIIASLQQSLAKTYPQHQIPEIPRSLIGSPLSEMIVQLLPGTNEKNCHMIETYFKLVYDNGYWKMCHLYHGVANTLAFLKKRGIRCYVATNKREYPTLKILEQTEISQYFADIATRGESTTSKANMIRGIVDRYGLSIEETLVVGDSAEDERAANINGLAFVAAGYGYGNIKQWQDIPRKLVIENIFQLCDIISESYDVPDSEIL